MLQSNGLEDDPIHRCRIVHSREEGGVTAWGTWFSAGGVTVRYCVDGPIHHSPGCREESRGLPVGREDQAVWRDGDKDEGRGHEDRGGVQVGDTRGRGEKGQ